MNAKKTVASLLVSLLLASSIQAWDPIKDLTGKRLDEHHQDLANSFDKLRKRPIPYLTGRLEEIALDVCSTPVRSWEARLRNQASGRWKSLPPQLIAAVARDYPGVDLRQVRYAEGISTWNENGQTIGYRIYFPERIDLWNYGHLRWMLHELEHTLQYVQRGGRSTFMCEYFAKLIGRGLQDEHIDMERAADRKANYLIQRVYQQMHGRGGLQVQQRPVFRPQVMPRTPMTTFCRYGGYWQQVAPGPAGSPCYMPRWNLRGVRSFR